MKKAAKKKIAKKAVRSKAAKTKPAKFDFVKLLTLPMNGKGKLYAKIMGPEEWAPGTPIKRDAFAEIEYTQFSTPNAGDKAEMLDGTCWAEYTLTKIHYATEPYDPAKFDDSAIYDGGN